MQLVYITHHSILNMGAFSPLISWVIVIGAGYGAIRLVIDINRYCWKNRVWPKPKTSAPEDPPPS